MCSFRKVKIRLASQGQKISGPTKSMPPIAKSNLEEMGETLAILPIEICIVVPEYRFLYKN